MYGWCEEELIQFEKTEEGMKEERLEQEVQLEQQSFCSCGKTTGVGASLTSYKQVKEHIPKSIRPKETTAQKNAMESTEKQHSGRKKTKAMTSELPG